MSKEAEILTTGLSCHDTLLLKSSKSRGGGGGSCISGVWVLQKLTLKLSDYGQSYLFNSIENFTNNRKCILTIT